MTRFRSVRPGSIVLLVAVIFIVINLLVDVSYGFFDPRIRYDTRDT